jgi:cell division protein DivIC
MEFSSYAKYYKNKFFVAGLVFFVYALFLDDVDIFTIINQNRKLHRLEASKNEIKTKLDSTRYMFSELCTNRALESFAREKKFFKQKNEDIFVIAYE